MTCYSHALVLIQDKEDGLILLNHAVNLAQSTPMQITLAHISEDYRMMNYGSDSLMNDVVSEDVIKIKALFSELISKTNAPISSRELVTMHRFEDVEKCINELSIDLVIAGHRNRFMGLLSSRSMEYINHLNVDVLIKHINPKI